MVEGRRQVPFVFRSSKLPHNCIARKRLESPKRLRSGRPCVFERRLQRVDIGGAATIGEKIQSAQRWRH